MANTMANTKNDLIIALVQKELQAKAKLLPFVSDMSAYAVKGAKSIAIPRLDSFTVANRVFGAAGVDTDLTDSTDDIQLNQNAYISWIEDHASIYQSTVEFRTEAIRRAASAHARAVDSALITAAIAGAYYTEPTAASDIDKSAVLAMRESVLKENGDLDKMVLAVSVDQEHILLGINEFVQEYSYGQANIPTGQIGRLFGMPVVVSNLLPAQQCLCFDKDGLAIAFQQAPSIGEEKDMRYGSKGVRVAVDQVYGVGILQDSVGSAAAGQSPLIAKLN